MTCSPSLSTGVKVLRCDFCHQPVSSAIPGDTMLRVSIIMCPDCLARVPEGLANKFLDSAAWPSVYSKSEEKDERKNG